ncbi:hypothetical protein [Virgibacillus sp. DJP39]|uniref:hypothetical protein n=1 Tax=Virgibacillus sp. DJP39 TaxID=3409790 RepID=UPI003BB7B3E3
MGLELEVFNEDELESEIEKALDIKRKLTEEEIDEIYEYHYGKVNELPDLNEKDIDKWCESFVKNPPLKNKGGEKYE